MLFPEYYISSGFPHGSVGKESACNAGDPGSIPGSGRSPGEENNNPLQYSCLENPMDRGAWQATVHGVAKTGHHLATKPPPFYLISQGPLVSVWELLQARPRGGGGLHREHAGEIQHSSYTVPQFRRLRGLCEQTKYTRPYKVCTLKYIIIL